MGRVNEEGKKELVGLSYVLRVEQTPRFALSANRQGFPVTLSNLSSILALSRQPTNGREDLFTKERLYENITRKENHNCCFP